ncbi:hypothetical protein LzC2_42850 [Planctomycetes bacterium LzC2]|uniref:Uncharacterized protein n=1 Tax=Alienimonas chondri TaxID=2681879 RepID=A0ABX1VJV3_9PLAN|nr:hypothetical protein [Alienimonas chondri]
MIAAAQFGGPGKEFGGAPGNAVTAADRAAAEWDARLKFFEKRLELLPGDPQDAVYGYAFQSLIDLIHATTGGVGEGGGWEEIEGEGGAMEYLETGPAGTGRAVLVVRQTDAVHRQIVALLTDLRAAPGEELDPESIAAAARAGKKPAKPAALDFGFPAKNDAEEADVDR